MSDSEITAQTPSDDLPAAAKGQRILIVDESATARAMLGDVLEEAGFDTHAIAAGDELARSTGTYAPHLVLLAFGPSSTDCIAGLANFLASPAGQSTVVIVTLTRDRVKEGLLAVKAGAADCIFKPFEPVEVFARVQLALEKHRAAAASRPAMSTQPQPAAEPEPRAAEQDRLVTDSMKHQFSACVSNEFRAPLTQVVQFVEQSKSQRPATQLRNAFEILRSFVTTAKQLKNAIEDCDATSSDGEIQAGKLTQRVERHAPIHRPHVALNPAEADEPSTEQPASG